MRYGPNAGMALQRSQYLADALRNLQASGSDIRTPQALGTSLLAEAITAYGKNKADKEAMQAYGQDRKAIADSALAGLGPDASPPPTSAPVPVPAPDAAAPQAAPPAQIQPGAPPQTDLPRGLRNNNPLNITGLPNGQTWNGQTGTDGNYAKFATPGDGWQAADKNLTAYALRHGINTVDGAIDRWSPGAPPAYSQQVAGALNVRPDQPVDFANPDIRRTALTAMARFENGVPVQFGQGAQPSAPQPAQSIPAPVPAAPPAPGGAAPLNAPPAGAAPAIPHGMVTPEEKALAARLMSDPRTYDQGLQMAYQLQERQAKALAPPDKMMWDPKTGRAVPIPGTETQQLAGQSPSDAAQRDAFGNISHAAIPGVQGAIPEGMVRDPQTGGYTKVPTQQAQTFRIPGTNGLFVMGPNGQPTKVGEDQYGPEQLLKMRDQVIASEPVKLYQQAQDAYGSMINAANQGPGGMRAYALRDTFARAINPGAVARVGTIQAIKEAQGVPDAIKGFFSNLQGDGDVDPRIAQQILDVTQGFVASHYAGAKALNDSNAEYAKRHGFDPADITAPLGDAPQRFVIPNAAQPAPATDPAVAAGASHIQRLYQDGKLTPEQIARARKLGVLP